MSNNLSTALSKEAAELGFKAQQSGSETTGTEEATRTEAAPGVPPAPRGTLLSTPGLLIQGTVTRRWAQLLVAGASAARERGELEVLASRFPGSSPQPRVEGSRGTRQPPTPRPGNPAHALSSRQDEAPASHSNRQAA